MKTIFCTNTSLFIVTGLIAVLAVPSSGALAAESWLTCRGSVTTLPATDPAQPVTAASQRVLAFNDEFKRLYQYSPDRKSLDIMPTATYTSDKISWGADLMSSSGMKWEGSLDRKNMEVSISRRDRYGEQMTWKEQCEPSAPALGHSQVASK